MPLNTFVDLRNESIRNALLGNEIASRERIANTNANLEAARASAMLQTQANSIAAQMAEAERERAFRANSPEAQLAKQRLSVFSNVPIEAQQRSLGVGPELWEMPEETRNKIIQSKLWEKHPELSPGMDTQGLAQKISAFNESSLAPTEKAHRQMMTKNMESEIRTREKTLDIHQNERTRQYNLNVMNTTQQLLKSIQDGMQKSTNEKEKAALLARDLPFVKALQSQLVPVQTPNGSMGDSSAATMASAVAASLTGHFLSFKDKDARNVAKQALVGEVEAWKKNPDMYKLMRGQVDNLLKPYNYSYQDILAGKEPPSTYDWSDMGTKISELIGAYFGAKAIQKSGYPNKVVDWVRGKMNPSQPDRWFVKTEGGWPEAVAGPKVRATGAKGGGTAGALALLMNLLPEFDPFGLKEKYPIEDPFSQEALDRFGRGGQ